MQIEIKLAGPKEAELIADLSRQTFYDTFASQNTVEDMNKFMNEQFSRDALMKETGTAGNIFMIARISGEPAGYVKLRDSGFRPGLENTASLEIARIYVVHARIGQGVGKALMQKCIDLAVGMKKELLWLGVWQENKTAIDFYKRWGFEIFGEQDFLLGNDLQKDWLMKKEINPKSENSKVEKP